MGKLIDAERLKCFFFSETSGTEDTIRDLMNVHGLDYANDINEDAVVAFAADLLKTVQNVIDTEPTAYDPDKVVKQLKDEVKEYDKRIERRNGDCYFDETEKIKALEERARGIERAIEIVKGGGVDG